MILSSCTVLNFWFQGYVSLIKWVRVLHIFLFFGVVCVLLKWSSPLMQARICLRSFLGCSFLCGKKDVWSNAIFSMIRDYSGSVSSWICFVKLLFLWELYSLIEFSNFWQSCLKYLFIFTWSAAASVMMSPFPFLRLVICAFFL